MCKDPLPPRCSPYPLSSSSKPPDHQAGPMGGLPAAVDGRRSVAVSGLGFVAGVCLVSAHSHDAALALVQSSINIHIRISINGPSNTDHTWEHSQRRLALRSINSGSAKSHIYVNWQLNRLFFMRGIAWRQGVFAHNERDIVFVFKALRISQDSIFSQGRP